MALIGTLIDSRSLAVAGTASGTFTHGLARVPHIVYAMASHATSSLATNFPYLAATWDSASVTVFNRGTVAETWTILTQFCHSIIQ